MLRALKPEDRPEPVVDISGNAQLKEKNLYLNQVSGAWRMTVRFRRLDATKPVEIRASIKGADRPLSEVWSYIVPPDPEKP